MSRIQNLLNKAERDGTVRRTRSLVDGERSSEHGMDGAGGNDQESQRRGDDEGGEPLVDRSPLRTPVGQDRCEPRHVSPAIASWSPREGRRQYPPANAPPTTGPADRRWTRNRSVAGSA